MEMEMEMEMEVVAGGDGDGDGGDCRWRWMRSWVGPGTYTSCRHLARTICMFVGCDAGTSATSAANSCKHAINLLWHISRFNAIDVGAILYKKLNLPFCGTLPSPNRCAIIL